MNEDKDVRIDESTGEVLETVAELDTSQREDAANDVTETADISNAELELKQGYREVTIEPYGLIRIYKPTIEDDNASVLAYSQEFSKLMMESNLPTIEEMESKLKERKNAAVISAEDINDVRKDFQEAVAELAIAKSEYKVKKTPALKNRIVKLEKEQQEYKKELLRKEAIRNKYVTLTIEGQADERKLMEKLYRCTKYPDGKRVWETLEDLKKEQSSESVMNIVYEFIVFSQGIDPRVLEQIPDLLDEVGDADLDI